MNKILSISLCKTADDFFINLNLVPTKSKSIELGISKINVPIDKLYKDNIIAIIE